MRNFGGKLETILGTVGLNLALPMQPNFKGQIKEMYSKATKKAGKALRTGTFSLAALVAACVVDGRFTSHGITVVVPAGSGFNIVSDYKAYEPHREREHTGIDFGAEAGTDVISPSYGKVLGITNSPSVGAQVLIEHPATYKETIKLQNGKTTDINWPVYILLAHLKEVNVKRNQILKPGDVVGKIARATSYGFSGPDHVHMGAQSSRHPMQNLLNPHEIWYDKEGTGIKPGYVACFDPKVKYSQTVPGIVAPIRCTN